MVEAAAKLAGLPVRRRAARRPLSEALNQTRAHPAATACTSRGRRRVRRMKLKPSTMTVSAGISV